MLRTIALALLLANAVYFAWGQGLLAAFDMAPARQSEPERLSQQIRPEAMQLIVLETDPLPPSAEVQPPPVPAPAPAASCLQVGDFTQAQAQALQPRLQAHLPEGSWSFESNGASVRWIIYIGKYSSRNVMNRHHEALQKMGLPFELPLSPALHLGLSLGSFASRTEAEDTLAQMDQRGLRSARVVPEQPDLPSLWLKLPVVDASLRTQLDKLKPQLAGKAVQSCA